MKRYIGLFLVTVVELAALSLCGCANPSEDTGGDSPGKADTAVVFQSATQVGGASGTADTSSLKLSFDVDPAALTADDISLTGASKGGLSGSGTTRSLAITNMTVADGATVSLSIASPAGYAISGSPKTAVVYRKTDTPVVHRETDTPVVFLSATQVGGASGTADTTSLKLSFDVDPAALTADNISLTGASKGALSGSGTTRSLAITNMTVADGGTVSVSIASPAGYAISGSPKTAVVYLDTSIPAGVYACGYYGSLSAQVPCYWHSGTRVDLESSGSSAASATGIAVNGTTVYTVGNYNSWARYWEGTAGTDLNGSQGTGIAFFGGKLYAAVQGNGNSYIASLVVNISDASSYRLPGSTDANNLPNGDTICSGIAGGNGAIYAVGYWVSPAGGHVCYWNGTTSYDLLPRSSILAYGISAGDGNVYCAGYYNGSASVPCIWQNTDKFDLPGSGLALAIDYANGVVYAVGYDGSIPCLWTWTAAGGGSRIELPSAGSGDSRALAVKVLAGTVYAAGYYNDGSKDVPCIWKRSAAGVSRTDLPVVGTGGARALGIALGQ